VTPHRAAVVAGNDSSVTLYRRFGELALSGNTLLPTNGAPGVVVPALNVNTALTRAQAAVLKIDAEGMEASLVYAVEDWSPIRAVVLEYHAELLGDASGVGLQEFLGYLQAAFPRVQLERSSTLARCFLVAAALSSGLPKVFLNE